MSLMCWKFLCTYLLIIDIFIPCTWKRTEDELTSLNQGKITHASQNPLKAAKVSLGPPFKSLSKASEDPTRPPATCADGLKRHAETLETLYFAI